MRCEDVERRLDDREDGLLTPEEERALEEHLAACASCRELAADLEEVVGAKFAVEADPEEAAKLIIRHIENKREALGLPFVAADETLTDKVA